MKKIRFFYLFLLLCFCGCSWISRSIVFDKEIDSFENQRIVVEILKKDFLQEKKTFFVESFKIGEDVEASKTIDHIVQTFQFGVEQGLRKIEQPIIYDVNYADVIVRGVVEKFKRPRWWQQKVFFLKKEAQLSVMVFLIDRRDSRVIAFSLGWNKMPFLSDDIEQQSYQMGKDIVVEIFDSK